MTQLNKPTIFLLEEDHDTRLTLNKMLTDKGYDVMSTATKEDAFHRVGDGLLKSDLVLVDLVKEPIEETINVGSFLRQNAKPNASLVVIAAKYGADLEGTTAQVAENEYVVYLETGDELFDLLSNLTNKKPKDAETTV